MNQPKRISSVHIEIEWALNLEPKKLRCKDNSKNNVENVHICRSGIVIETITFVIAIVSNPEFLLFKVECLIGFGNAITPRNHKTFKPASKSGYPNIWRVDSFEKIREISSSFFSWLRCVRVGKVEKNFHTFLLSSSLIRRLIGP